jgi:hypothetical protein
VLYSSPSKLCSVVSSSVGKIILSGLVSVWLLTDPLDISIEAKIQLNAIVFGYAMFTLARFMKLQMRQHCLQAFDERRAHPVRPPPKPDPVEDKISYRSQRASRKALVDEMRASSAIARQHRRAQQIYNDESSREWSSCWLNVKLVYLPFFLSMFISWLQHLYHPQWLMLAYIWLGVCSWLQLMDVKLEQTFGFNPFHAFTESFSIVVNILQSVVHLGFLCIIVSIDFLIKSVGHCIRQSFVSHVCWNTDLCWFEALCIWRFLVKTLWQVIPSSLSTQVGSVILCLPTGSIGFLEALNIAFFVGNFCPFFKNVVSFIRVDIPSAYRESITSDNDDSTNLAVDLDSILTDNIEAEVKSEEELIHSLTMPPIRVPASTFIAPSSKWLFTLSRVFGLLKCPKALLLLSFSWLLGSSTSSVHASPHDVSYTAISHPIRIEPDSFDVSVCMERLGWRERRQFKRISSKVEQVLFAKLMKEPSQPISSPIDLEPTPESIYRAKAYSFLRGLDLADEARQWLVASHLDKAVLGRQSSDLRKVEDVSIDLRTGTKSSYVEKSVLVGAVESVFNSLGQMGVTPLIVDSGASCCVTPRREDFISYSESSVRIKDLSGVNKVAGEGLIEWTVVDKHGKPCTITIKGYHVPKASVRLISPQCLCQAFKGTKGIQDHEIYVIKLIGGAVLEAPYGAANLPILKLSDPDNPECRWLKCFSFRNTSPTLWSDNVMAAKNQNLTAAQKELLRWHQRLSHAGLTTIHNLCRQKRAARVDTVNELEAIREGAMLPCTFNVPAAVCDGLLCAACQTANASRRAPTVCSGSS